MPITVYSATGCVRCRIAKQFLNERGLTFQDHDALGEGRQAFRSFYQSNRQKIYRGPDGVEFPVYHEGDVIRQGLPAVVAYQIGGPALSGFFKPGSLHGQWLDGICISGGPSACCDDLLQVLSYLKKQNFKIRIDTNGVNANLLASILEHGLADRVIMEVKGPPNLYKLQVGQSVDMVEIEKSIALVSKCGDYAFITFIAPVARQTGDPAQISYITPEEIGQTAELIKKAAGDSRQPYGLRTLESEPAPGRQSPDLPPLPQSQLFRYRSAARKYQFRAEILKD
jgi:glutaredoxin